MPRRKPPLPKPPPPPPPVGQVLKLTFEKGPLSGQTSLFNAGSTINLGRIARGNTISVKDSGISSKHLRIRVEDSGSGQFWAVTDLGSSNGTLLNESDIEVSVPIMMVDGDLLKIGEETTIRIEFVEIDQGNEASCNTKNGNGNNLTRRSVKGNVRNKKGKIEELGVIDEDSDLGLGFQNGDGEEKVNGSKETVNGSGHDGGYKMGNSIAGRTMCEVIEVSTSEVEEGQAIVNEIAADKGKKVGTRGRPRSSKKSEDAIILTSDVGGTSEMVAEVEVNRGKFFGGRITRSSKRSNHIEVSVSEIDEAATAMEVEIERGRFGRRVTRNSKKADDTLMNSTSINSVKNSVVGVLEKMVSTRMTTRKVENTVETENDYSTVFEGKEMGKAPRGRKKRPLNASLEEKELPLLQKEADIGDDAEEERISVEKQGGTSVVRDDQANIKENSIADLEKMKIGEWLDYLEIYLPKQIADTTEEMIAEMRRKAEGVHKFMSAAKE